MDAGMDATMGAPTCMEAACAKDPVCTSVDGGQICLTPCGSDADCAADRCCDGLCRDILADPLHCGSCGRACERDELCNGGTCEPLVCTPDLTVGEDGGTNDVPAAPGGCPPNEDCVMGDDGPACMCGESPGCRPGHDCTPDGSCRCGASPACGPDDSCCDGACTDLDADPMNCGRCGRVCAGDTVCASGLCVCPTAGDIACDGVCVDPASSTDHCGTCGNACLPGQVCYSRSCVCSTPTAIVCDQQCVPGDSSDHCGTCGNACTGDQICTSDDTHPLDCYCPTLDHTSCGGTCVDLQNDPDHCGACDDPCEGPANVCRQGRCECPDADESPCGDTCVDLSVGTTDGGAITHCGQCDLTCEPGASCDAGDCTCPDDPPGFKYCDEDPLAGGAVDGIHECVDARDVVNCYACGNSCIGSSHCDATAMDCVCDDPSLEFCSDGCVDVQVSAEHCGGCEQACEAGRRCANGACCRATELACSTPGGVECIDPSTDPDNCGACGVTCDAGETCCEGSCRAPSFFESNVSHCGMCGRVCPPVPAGFLGGTNDPVCTGGVCG